MINALAMLKTAAGVKFRGKAPRVWFLSLGDNNWRAIIINSITKEVLCHGQVKDSIVASLDNLRAKIQPNIIKCKTI
jgi:hypothetical protein